MRRGYIGAGSNRGDREGHLRQGLAALERSGISVLRWSSLWETEPLDGAGPDWFLNLVAEIAFDGTPRALLDVLQRVEREAGRVRTAPNEARELDLDVLWIEGESSADPDLTVPHPRMWQRGFVLAPLAELAPELRDPRDGRSVIDALVHSRGRIRRVGTLRRDAGGGGGG